MIWRQFNLAKLVVLAACFVCQPVFMPCGGIAFAQPRAQGEERDALERAKLAVEVEKLKAELAELQHRQTVIGQLVGFAGVLAAAVTAIGSILLLLLNTIIRGVQRKQLEQDRRLARGKEIFDLLRGLGDPSSPARNVSAAALLQTLRDIRDGIDTRPKREQDAEQRLILQVLLSFAKDGQADEVLLKTLGDQLVDLLGADVKDGQEPGRRSPLKKLNDQRLDLQKVRLPDVLWHRVDGRGVDFFGADFSRASLREAFLKDAIFFDARLERCVLRDADLSNANLQNAILIEADLRGADLRGANLQGAQLKGARSDERTKWPEGFDMAALR